MKLCEFVDAIGLLALVVACQQVVGADDDESVESANLWAGVSAERRNRLAASTQYLLVNSTSEQLALAPREQQANTTSQLELVLARTGPDLRPASGRPHRQEVSLAVAQLAWRRMHQHARLVARDRVDLMWPVVEETLRLSGVSAACLAAANETAKAARELKTWAIQLLNSWASFPPAGIFEGTLGDVGSFHGCLEVPQSPEIGHAHYCALLYRPVLPTPPAYELVVSQVDAQLLALFGRDDAFGQLLQNVQYNHYVYFKFGTCFPIRCTPLDVQKFGRLLGRRAVLTSGPVKCHSRFSADYEAGEGDTRLEISYKDLNGGVYIWKPHMRTSQLVALWIVGALSACVLLFTLADFLLNRLGASSRTTRIELTGSLEKSDERGEGDGAGIERSTGQTERPSAATNGLEPGQKVGGSSAGGQDVPLMRQLVSDCSLITNTRDFFTVAEHQLKSDILCLNGLRCLTMAWIILAHTIQYNDWSAFARIYAVEGQILSWLNQPIFSASYLVDTFFLISGLLTSYSLFRRAQRGLPASQAYARLWCAFSARSYLVGRYLRLTPQILLVSLLFMLLPLGSPAGGPHWATMTGEYSENCANNWWVNLLHVQALYKSHEMCNFASWWISVDMLYHLLALALIMLTLRLARPRLLVGLAAGCTLANWLLQARRHFQLALPPNLLASIPQVGAMWTDMTLEYFWTPVAHVAPFLLGLALGLLMASRAAWLAKWLRRRPVPLAGWLAAPAAIAAVLLSSHWWVTGEAGYTRPVATSFALASQMVWSLALAWIIVACHFGPANFITRLLACRLFIILGRASYLVYLSHFLVLFTFFGSQNLLLEPTRLVMLYIIIGNICLSMLFGSLLCIAFELAWLKIQKRIMRHI